MIGKTDFDFLPQEEARKCRDDQIARSAAIIADKVNEMKSIELSPQERDSFAESAHSICYGRKPEKDIPILPHQLLEERRYDDNCGTIRT